MVALLPLFPLPSSFRSMQPDGGSLELDATADGCYYVETADDQVEGLASSVVDVCASVLKASLFNLCLYLDIVASIDACVSSLYSSPRGPWLVIWSLCFFYLCLELCCDIFPWVPDLDRTHLHVWLVYGRNGGVTSWYQSRLPIGSPFPTPWPKLSLVFKNYFTNMAVWLTGPSRQLGGIRIFYSLSILWDSILSSIRVKWNY